MKFAVMCDMHLPECTDAVQYDYLYYAIDNIKKEGVDFLIVNGDISATGEDIAFKVLKEKLAGVKYVAVLGNSDVRSGDRCSEKYKSRIICADRNIYIINTAFDHISEPDKIALSRAEDDDIIVMHHSIEALSAESKTFMISLLESKKILLIHAHSHGFRDYACGKSRVVCARALDPEKSIGAPPAITYFNVDGTDIAFHEKIFPISADRVLGFKNYIGMSCFDNNNSIRYAIKRKICNIELKFYDSEHEKELLALVKEWRAEGGNSLSIHMPNISLIHNGIKNVDKWKYAIEFAEKCNANALTLHPPRNTLLEVYDNKDELSEFYLKSLCELRTDVKIGFENLHMNKNEVAGNNRGYGYIPEEILLLSEAVNKSFGYERTGVVLDVGHARNNAPYNSKFTLGMFFASVGKYITAYHIHQVIRTDGRLHNHCAIENWFGPMISYSAFFKAWEKGQINKAPVFFEMRSIEDVEKSMDAFNLLKEM